MTSPDDRQTFFLAARRARYAWALEVDPKAVKAFEALLADERERCRRERTQHTSAALGPDVLGPDGIRRSARCAYRRELRLAAARAVPRQQGKRARAGRSARRRSDWRSSRPRAMREARTARGPRLATA